MNYGAARPHLAEVGGFAALRLRVVGQFEPKCRMTTSP